MVVRISEILESESYQKSTLERQKRIREKYFKEIYSPSLSNLPTEDEKAEAIAGFDNIWINPVYQLKGEAPKSEVSPTFPSKPLDLNIAPAAAEKSIFEKAALTDASIRPAMPVPTSFAEIPAPPTPDRIEMEQELERTQLPIP